MLDFNSVQFVWPVMLWALGLWPLAWPWVVWLSRRTAVHALWPGHRVSALGQAKNSSTRHWVAFCWLLGLAMLLLSLARPQAIVLLPSRLDTVMLAIDTSGSMRATDVSPSRMDAALAAVKVFIEEQPLKVKVGTIAFAGNASILQAPTTQRDELYKSIANLPMQRGSAIGSAVVVALASMLPGSGIDVEKIIAAADGPPERDTGRALATPGKGQNQVALEPASNKSMVIVLITDGQSNIGPDPIKMAQLAADHGVRVYTVGVGTPEGATVKANGMSMRVRLDEAPLKKIADITGAQYFRATHAADLVQIYQALGTTIRLEKQQLTEVTGVCLFAGMLLVMLGAATAFGRKGRVI